MSRKNSNASAIFTKHELSLIKSGSKKLKMSGESIKNVDACSLCLKTVPLQAVCCRKGHLFCKICIFENLLEQKKMKKKQLQLYNNQRDLIENERMSIEQKKNEEKIGRFDKKESLLFSTTSTKTKKEKEKEKQTEKGKVASDLEILKSLKDKNKFDELLIDNRVIKDKDLTQLREGGVRTLFTVPNSSSTSEKLLKKPSKRTLCPVGGESLRLRGLINLKLTETVDKKIKEMHRYSCPSCLKEITNSVTIYVVVKCGHCFCSSCCTNILRKNKVCIICDSVIKKKNDIIQLQKGGTSFSSHNKLVSKTSDKVAHI
ncbi:enos interacting protein [Anaeramoeba flamelloides]|uniref:Enos interacting protein n=1 Tax=Anaeramoeba flamelloides TaxID=1746091 RepID=A0ABQ8X1W8_9EUKA|nr:enos interacting protein [Anaeramoeba flamelloides]